MGTDNRMRKHYFSMRLHEYEDALLEAKKDEANMTKCDIVCARRRTRSLFF